MFGKHRQEKLEAKQDRIIDFLSVNGPSTAYEIYENTRNQKSSRTDSLVFVVLANCVEAKVIRRVVFRPSREEMVGEQGETFVGRYYQMVNYIEQGSQYPPTLFCLPDHLQGANEPGPDPVVSLDEAHIDISVPGLGGQIWLRSLK